MENVKKSPTNQSQGHPLPQRPTLKYCMIYSSPNHCVLKPREPAGPAHQRPASSLMPSPRVTIMGRSPQCAISSRHLTSMVENSQILGGCYSRLSTGPVKWGNQSEVIYHCKQVGRRNENAYRVNLNSANSAGVNKHFKGSSSLLTSSLLNTSKSPSQAKSTNSSSGVSRHDNISGRAVINASVGSVIGTRASGVTTESATLGADCGGEGGGTGGRGASMAGGGTFV